MLTVERRAVLLALMESGKPYSTLSAGRLLHPTLSKPAQYAQGRRVLRWLADKGVAALVLHGHYVLTEKGRIACALLLAKESIRANAHPAARDR